MDRRLVRRRVGPAALGLVIGGLSLCSHDIAKAAPPPIAHIAPTIPAEPHH
jgi:hypothetical protein